MNAVVVSKVQGRVPITILHLQERINLGNTSQLEDAAKQAISGGAFNILLDLSKAPSITSAGIRSVIIIHKMLTEAGKKTTGKLKLLSPTPFVKNVLEVAGLLDYIEVYSNLDEAVASF